MALMEWNDSLSVGFAPMDEDHKQLAGLLNDLDDAVVAGRGTDALAPLLNDLIDHTALHFRHEEKLMQAHGDPEYIAHKIEHEKLLRIASEMQTQFRNGDTDVTNELLPFLREWLIDHILGIDAKTARFLAENAA